MKPEAKIRVMVFRPDQPGEVRTIANELEPLQQIVGGHLEMLGIGNGLTLTCNDRGKLDGLAGNRWLRGPGGDDELVGAFLVSRTDGEELASLNDEDIEVLESWKPGATMIIVPAYTVAPDGQSITCNRCGMTSHNLNDVVHRYCGHCHKFLE